MTLRIRRRQHSTDLDKRAWHPQPSHPRRCDQAWLVGGQIAAYRPAIPLRCQPVDEQHRPCTTSQGKPRRSEGGSNILKCAHRLCSDVAVTNERTAAVTAF